LTPSPDPNLWPASSRLEIVKELAQGRDTLAGLARRHQLPVRVILEWRNQFQRETGSQAQMGGNLLMDGISPAQSRFAGPC
jgi:transposase-like protein